MILNVTVTNGISSNPRKDFKKPAIDIHESYFRNSLNLATNDFKKLNLIKWIKECFNNGSNDIQSIFTENGIYSEDSISEIESKLTDGFFEMFDNSNLVAKQEQKAINDLTSLNNLKNDEGENIIIKGDPIIQIGTVFHKYGETECYDDQLL